MFNEFLSFIGDAFTAVGDIIVNIFAKLITIFWNTDTGITLWGVIFIIVLVFSIVIFFIREILRWAGVSENQLEDNADLNYEDEDY